MTFFKLMKCQTPEPEAGCRKRIVFLPIYQKVVYLRSGKSYTTSSL